MRRNSTYLRCRISSDLFRGCVDFAGLLRDSEGGHHLSLRTGEDLEQPPSAAVVEEYAVSEFSLDTACGHPKAASRLFALGPRPINRQATNRHRA